MKKILVRMLSICLLATLIVGASTTVIAAAPTTDISPQASDYYSKRTIHVVPVGSGKLNIDIKLEAKRTMLQLGILEIHVYEGQTDGSYKKVRTYTKDAYPSLIYKNCMLATPTVQYQGAAGKKYYVTAHSYAKDVNGEEKEWMGSITVTAT